MILYIHGFRSCDIDNKLKFLLKEKSFELIYGTFPIQPKKQIKELENIIKKHKIKKIIASSIGAYYATYLSSKYNLKAVLINPSVKPYKTMMMHTGKTHKRFCNDEEFKFKLKYLKELKKYKIKNLKGEYLILLKKGDEVLNYKKAKKRYKDYHIIIDKKGCHSFNDLNTKIEIIKNFLKD
jgi:predicted esterase YcpF (UPF0227 family)